MVRKGKAKVAVVEEKQKLSSTPPASAQEIKISNSFNGLIPYVYDTSDPMENENDLQRDTPVIPNCDRLKTVGLKIDIESDFSPPASPISSRQRKWESQM